MHQITTQAPTFTVAWHPKKPLLAYACDDKVRMINDVTGRHITEMTFCCRTSTVEILEGCGCLGCPMLRKLITVLLNSYLITHVFTS